MQYPQPSWNYYCKLKKREKEPKCPDNEAERLTSSEGGDTFFGEIGVTYAVTQALLSPLENDITLPPLYLPHSIYMGIWITVGKLGFEPKYGIHMCFHIDQIICSFNSCPASFWHIAKAFGYTIQLFIPSWSLCGQLARTHMELWAVFSDVTTLWHIRWVVALKRRIANPPSLLSSFL